MPDSFELVVIGAGPAGLAAALAAENSGLEDILLVERDDYPGGILQQCIHNGFGLDYFGEELTGPEYAERFIRSLHDSGIELRTGTMVLSLSADRELLTLSHGKGLRRIRAGAVVLAMGCRERTREALCIPGDRPAGIFTAGTAQRYTNIEGYIPGREVVVLGSGDIGMIMARRMTLEGATVRAVLEIMPYSTGLIRNRVQCLEDFEIPLLFEHTVTRIHGSRRLEGVTTARVDGDLEPIPGTEREIDCDTLLLSVGLIPENELTLGAGLGLDPLTGGPAVNQLRETEVRGIFACGNVLHVHDLVDYVTEEAEVAGRAAAEFVLGNLKYGERTLKVRAGQGVRYVVPQRIEMVRDDGGELRLFLRVEEPAEGIRINIANERGEVLIGFPKRVVTPGEMVTVKLPHRCCERAERCLEVAVSG